MRGIYLNLCGFVAVEENPILVARFQVSFSDDSFANAGFNRISGLGYSADVTEYREGGETMTTRKLPGLTKFPALTFERGSTSSQDMVTWVQQCYVVSPNTIPLADTYDGGFRKSLIINAYDNQQNVKKSWNVINAWPSDIRFGDFDAMSSAVMIESMTVQNEGIYEAAGAYNAGSGTNGVPTQGDLGVSIGIEANL